MARFVFPFESWSIPTNMSNISNMFRLTIISDARGSQGFHLRLLWGSGWNASHMLHVQIITYIRWTNATFNGKCMENSLHRASGYVHVMCGADVDWHMLHKFIRYLTEWSHLCMISLFTCQVMFLVQSTSIIINLPWLLVFAQNYSNHIQSLY